MPKKSGKYGLLQHSGTLEKLCCFLELVGKTIILGPQKNFALDLEQGVTNIRKIIGRGRVKDHIFPIFLAPFPKMSTLASRNQSHNCLEEKSITFKCDTLNIPENMLFWLS